MTFKITLSRKFTFIYKPCFRIPGLSKYFLYFNDDIFLGKTIWPEDFLTESEGYKIFITWNLPDCTPSCTWSWVGDGSCDAPCNNEQCSYDGGDCNQNDSTHIDHYPKLYGRIYEEEEEKEIQNEFKVLEEFYHSVKVSKENNDYLGAKDLPLGTNRKLLQITSSNTSYNPQINYLFTTVNSRDIRKQILDVFKTSSHVNISEIVRVNNLKYLESNKAVRKLKKNLRKNNKKISLLAKSTPQIKNYNLNNKNGTQLLYNRSSAGENEKKSKFYFLLSTF